MTRGQASDALSSSKTFAAQAVACRAIFPEQRALVERLLNPTVLFVRSSKAAQLVDLDEGALRRQQAADDVDGVADRFLTHPTVKILSTAPPTM